MNISEILQVIREEDRGKIGNCMAAYYSVNIPDKGWVCRLTGVHCESGCKQCVFAAIAWEKGIDRNEVKE